MKDAFFEEVLKGPIADTLKSLKKGKFHKLTQKVCRNIELKRDLSLSISCKGHGIENKTRFLREYKFDIDHQKFKRSDEW